MLLGTLLTMLRGILRRIIVARILPLVRLIKPRFWADLSRTPGPALALWPLLHRPRLLPLLLRRGTPGITSSLPGALDALGRTLAA